MDQQDSMEKPCDNVDVPASTWTSAAATISGPKFLALEPTKQRAIQKLHNNLSHPTAERLAKHLAEQGASTEMIDAAKNIFVPHAPNADLRR